MRTPGPWCAIRGTQNVPASQGNEEDAEAPSTTKWVGVAGKTPYHPPQNARNDDGLKEQGCSKMDQIGRA